MPQENKWGLKLSVRALMPWAVLFVLAILLTGVFKVIKLPGEALIGPLIAGIIVAVRFGSRNFPENTFHFSQTLVFCFIGSAFTPESVKEILLYYPIFFTAVFGTIASAILIAMVIQKLKLLPLAEAILGLAPGAAIAMAPVAEDLRADVRLVMVMQFMRLIIVLGVTAIVGQVYLLANHIERIEFHDSAGAVQGQVILSFALVVVIGLITRRIPAVSVRFILPMMLVGAANAAGLITAAYPMWAVYIGFAVLGAGIGLKFDMAAVRHALFSLPTIVISSLLLMLSCAAIAVVISQMTEIDLMTAYLATSPGGTDAAVILAVGVGADPSFVAGTQITRLFVLMMTGPFIFKKVIMLTERRRTPL